MPIGIRGMVVLRLAPVVGIAMSIGKMKCTAQRNQAAR
jgi:hypothetical protein